MLTERRRYSRGEKRSVGDLGEGVQRALSRRKGDRSEVESREKLGGLLTCLDPEVAGHRNMWALWRAAGPKIATTMVNSVSEGCR